MSERAEVGAGCRFASLGEHKSSECPECSAAPLSSVVGLAHAIAGAHRKLRYGSQHPEKASQPNALAFAIAEALVDKTFSVEVEVEDDEEFCARCFAGTESSEHHEKCGEE